MRRPELKIKRARGFLLIVAILVLVVIAVAIAALGNMTSADIRASSGHSQSEQAYFVGQSGLEYASFQYGSGTACDASLTNTGVSVGNGAFSTRAQTYASSAATVSPVGLNIGATSVAAAGSTAAYAPHGRIRIDTEEIDYSNNSGSGFSGLKRGVAGTSAAAHASGAVMRQDLCWIQSTGIVDSAARVLERTLHEASSMFAYAKTSDNVPYFRLWDGVAWGAEQNANAMPAGATRVQWMVLKFARTRNEALLGTLDTLGDIRLQLWNGFTWTNLNGGAALSNIGTTNDGFRGFDIEYETASDRAIIVYNNANATSPYYRIWDGSNMSGAVALSSGGNLGNYPGGAAPIWIELAPNPLRNSNEIVLMTESITANDSVYGARWNGSQWDSMGQSTAAVWDNSVGNGNDRKAIDVAYEQSSGRAMFLWGNNASGSHVYRIWDGANLSAAATFTIAAAGGNPEWVKLAPDPYSNQIMLGSQDSGSDLNTRLWSGSAWNGAAVNPEHDNAVESATERTFDVAFESHTSQIGSAWIVWGDATTVSQRNWSGAWGATTVVAGSDDTGIVQLRAHPTSGTLFSAWYESSAAGIANRRILTRQLTSGGGAWSATTQQFRPNTTVNSPLQARIFFATRKVIVIDTVEIYP